MNVPDETRGLTSKEAAVRLEKYGKNQLTPENKQSFFNKALHIIMEPMFLLLIVAAVIYFVLGEPRDGAIMLIFVVGIITIDIVQEWKTDKTLDALKDLSAPRATVIRDGVEVSVASADIVPGDVMLIHEGMRIPADGYTLTANDLSVDESSLTGESEPVWKLPRDKYTHDEHEHWRRDYCYAGTLVIQGSAAVLVDKTGASTEYGKIGTSVAGAPTEKTPLQKQTASLVKTCTGIAAVLFALVGVLTYINIPDHDIKSRVIESILSGITLAMAMIPEEFPVILTVFLSMGAWRLAKKDSLVRRLNSVETLGAVSVLCVDKTGTITINKMKVDTLWAFAEGNEEQLMETMGLGCETNAYDPMEKAMLEYCDAAGIPKEHLFGGELITEYPFTNELKMMGHVWRHDGELLIACKGSPERILTLCDLTHDERIRVETEARALSERGLRVIAVGIQSPSREEDIPHEIIGCSLTLLGLVGLYDPPRETVAGDIARCRRAGIRVVMITGDNGVTAASIAREIGMSDSGSIITGDMLDSMTDEELCRRVRDVSIFSRVIPEHKMRIVNAFKANGEIVAMTGDGVNDAPALRYADIGIAMGKRGSEVAREAADLILMDDNFSTIVDTVRDGRRIYDNIRKAVGYVFTIHIPIALSSLLAPLIKLDPSELFLLPLHVVLLELLIDPTCSIVLERQPAEDDIMSRPPRSPKEKILTARTLTKSIIQGLALFAASFGMYYYTLRSAGSAPAARAAGLAVLMLGNLLLVQVNSSDRDFAIHTAGKLIKDKVMWAVNVGTLLLLVAVIYTPLAGVLKLASLTFPELMLSFAAAAVSVLWYEIVKLVKKSRKAK